MHYEREGIAMRIKTERKMLGLTMEELANLLNVDRNTITAWERQDGKRRTPNLDDLLRMCNLFNCELGYLLGEHSGKTRAETDIQAKTGLSFESISSLAYLYRQVEREDAEEENKDVFDGFFLMSADIDRQHEVEQKILNTVNLMLSSNTGLGLLYCIAEYINAVTEEKIRTYDEKARSSEYFEGSALRGLAVLEGLKELRGEMRRASDGKHKKADK